MKIRICFHCYDPECRESPYGQCEDAVREFFNFGRRSHIETNDRFRVEMEDEE